MTSVWVLTEGCYSDLTVEGVFSSLEECKKVTECFPDGGWNEPKEFVLDEMLGLTEKGYFRFVIHVRNNVQRVTKNFPDQWGNSIHIFKPAAFYTYTTDDINASIVADTEERALKVFSEKLAMMKSEGMTQLEW